MGHGKVGHLLTSTGVKPMQVKEKLCIIKLEAKEARENPASILLLQLEKV
jgi:hypothetical protein